jgi:hypothetical protein
MNTFKSLGPILAMGLSPFAAFSSSDESSTTEPEHPVNVVVQLQVHTFPEPCADEFTLVVPDGLRGHTRAMLLDGSYRTVLEWPLGFSETAGSRVDVPMNGLDPGTYTLRVWDEYGDAGATIIEHQ